MSSLGSKRAASSSQAEETRQAKKQKVEAVTVVSDATPLSTITTNPTETVASSSPAAAAPTALQITSADPASVESSPLSEIDEAEVEELLKPAKPAPKAKKTKAKQVPVKDLFTPWKPDLSVPPFNDAWGRKPCPGPEGPQPHPNSPPARTSNAQTNPPLWEDRKFRFKKGSRFVKSFRKGEEVDPDAADLDQEDNLVLYLIDMRPKSKKDPTPRRKPTAYAYENGIPKDWDDKQTVKALNDRRQQAIDRITMDAPWTNHERQFLASLLEEFPDASILELTERFNFRFMNKESAKATAFSWDYISTGRTVESIRHEYLTYKHKYDQGIAPEKKELLDKSPEGLAARKLQMKTGKDRMAAFGKMDKIADEDDSDDESEETPKKVHQSKKKSASGKVTKSRKQTIVPKSEAVIVETDDESAVPSSESPAPSGGAPASAAVEPPLSPLSEELAELGGFYNPEEVRNSPTPELPPDSPVQAPIADVAGSQASRSPAHNSSIPSEPQEFPVPSRRSSLRSSQISQPEIPEQVIVEEMQIEAQEIVRAKEQIVPAETTDDEVDELL